MRHYLDIIEIVPTPAPEPGRQVLDTRGGLALVGHVTSPQLEGRSVTGLCLGAARDTLVTVNWRTRCGRGRLFTYNLPTPGPRTLAELSLEGATLATFTHPDMVEPVAVAVAPRGEFVVADNVSGLLVFDPCGKLLRHGHGVEVTVPP